jgi:ribosomal protein S18 acetylase RimI-like enzyme
MKIVMRNLKSSDVQTLSELLKRIPVFGGDDQCVAMELLNIIVEQPGQKDYLCIVAVDGANIPIGYACFGPTPLTDGTFSLYWIAVEPMYSRHGVGSQLLHTVEMKICRMHGRMLVLETSSINSYEQARQFYERNNFTLVEAIQDFYREGEDRVTYIKRLG